MIRTLLVDDEPIARAGLRSMLAADPDIEIVGECSNGLAAVDAILQLQPDLLLLDVQMPDLDGFGVLRAIPRSSWPAIIFVTAFDRYAIQAFDLNAVDYLLKPFGDARALEAVARAKQRLRAEQAQVETVLRTVPMQRIAVRIGSRTLLIDVNTIRWLEAEGDYVRVHTVDGTHLIRASLTELSEPLSSARFARASRSAVLNTAFVRELRPAGHGDQVALLDDGTEVRVSRRYALPLKQTRNLGR